LGIHLESIKKMRKNSIHSFGKITLLLLFLTLVFVVFYLFKDDSIAVTAGPEHTVELRADGFYPETIAIQQGSTIIFSTTKTSPFWPASNLHPLHTIYPKLDSQRPLDQHESWSFRFDDIGKWEYHDHLNPTYTGRIIVVNEQIKRVITSEYANDCADLPVKERQLCWKNLTVEILEKEGLEGGYKLLSDIYTSESEFPGFCHGITHILGEAAYHIFVETGEVPLSPETYYCSFGFYHAFIESNIVTTGDFKEVISLCSYVEGVLGKRAKDACYHGIGHGLTDGSNKETWGDPQAFIKEALLLCEEIAENEYYISKCAAGVFNSLAIIFNRTKLYSQFNLKPDLVDPYKICREQEDEYFKIPCYQKMESTVLAFNNKDLSRSVAHAAKIKNDIHAAAATENLTWFSFWWKGVDSFDEERSIEFCRGLQDRLHLPCIRGFAAGLTEFSPPLKNERGIQFCQSKRLTEDEIEACLEGTIPYLQIVYSSDKVKEICSTAISAKYRKQYCE